jgi:arylsulfatase A-like enzyme
MQDDKRRPPGLPTIIGVALASGIVGGVLFTIRDCMRALLGRELMGPCKTASWLLSFGLDVLFWYTLTACALMVLCGAAIWALTRVGHNFGGPRLVAACSGLLTFVIVSVALLFLHDLALGQSGVSLEEAWPLFEIVLLAVLTACGVATLLVHLRERLPQPGRLLAWVCACSVSAFLLSFGLVWLNLGNAATSSTSKTLMGHALLLAVAILLGRGLYLAVWGLGDAAGRRRRLTRGTVMLAAGGLLWAGAAVVVAYRAERDFQKELRRAPTTSNGRPNVLWIVLDTARADVLSCYGNPRETTPNIDRLASEATQYDRAFAACSWTLPSHASMFTGLLPSDHRVMGVSERLNREHVTVAEILAEQGYRTYCYSNNTYLRKGLHVSQGFDELIVYRYGHGHEQDLLLGKIRTHLQLMDYGARDTNRAVSGWLRESARTEQPFFIFVNYMEIHKRYGCTPEWDRWTEGKLSLRALQGMTPIAELFAVGLQDSSPERLALYRALYDADAHYLDARVGELLQCLRDTGAYDDTLIIVTGDHGEEFGEHQLLAHAFGLYNTTLHVPLIVRYPKRFEAGVKLGHPVSLLDIFPTILDVTGIDWDGASRLRGRSLLAEPAERWLVAEKGYPMRRDHGGATESGHPRLFELYRRCKSIQNSEFKFIWAEDGQHELYRILGDPEEQKNLVLDLPEVARDLEAKLAERVGGLPPHPIRRKADRGDSEGR